MHNQALKRVWPFVAPPMRGQAAFVVTLLLAFASWLSVGLNTGAAAPSSASTCWPVHRTDHPMLTVSNGTALTLVAARVVRTFGVNRCVDAAHAAASPETVRTFAINATLHNRTATALRIDAGCRLYDAQNGALHPMTTLAITVVGPGKTIHLTTCEFDPPTSMGTTEPFPPEWGRVSHATLYIAQIHGG
jgi:hypothetical protein